MTMVRRFPVVALLACVLLTVAANPAQAEERILSFHSDIVVQPDSSMTVTETIKVVAQGNKIKRGIYRDFPTRYKGRLGQTIRVGFDVRSVKRDGNVEPYHIKREGNGQRVYIGRKDHHLSSGEYTYELTYETDHQLVYNEDTDELYWNVTGNGWDFSIATASATVTLPDTVPSGSVQMEGYTGPQGSKATDLTTRVEPGPRYAFTATRTLRAREGLTIVATWPKGHVTEPSQVDKLKHVAGMNPSGYAGLIGVAAALVYYLFAWALVGRDPAKGTIIPHFEPPDGISPAAARFIREMGYDDKCMAAAVISLAVKKALRIEQRDSTFSVKRAGKPDASVAKEERRVHNKLLGKKGSLDFKQSNHRTIGPAVSALKTSLSRQFEKTYFLGNVIFWIPGILILVGTAIAVALVAPSREDAFGASVFLAVWSFAVMFLLYAVVAAWRNLLFVDRSATSIGAALFITLFATPFTIAEGVALFMVAEATSPVAALSLLLIGVLIWTFYSLMKAPTLLGRKTMDHLDGLRMYMSVAETDRLRMLHPPEKTPEHFEELLPYALALDVEQEWADQFTEVLAAAAQSGSQTGYHPHWYSGPSGRQFTAGAMAGALGGAMASAISSSATAPGSSSGSGGGGSSGGGGGGGGGGGW